MTRLWVEWYESLNLGRCQGDVSALSRLVLVPSQPPVQWLLGRSSFPGSIVVGVWGWHLPPSSANFKNIRSCTSNPLPPWMPSWHVQGQLYLTVCLFVVHRSHWLKDLCMVHGQKSLAEGPMYGTWTDVIGWGAYVWYMDRRHWLKGLCMVHGQTSLAEGPMYGTWTDVIGWRAYVWYMDRRHWLKGLCMVHGQKSFTEVTAELHCAEIKMQKDHFIWQ